MPRPFDIVAGLLLILSVILIGIVHVFASVEADRYAQIRRSLSYYSGFEMTHIGPDIDSLGIHFDNYWDGTLDAYLEGRRAGALLGATETRAPSDPCTGRDALPLMDRPHERPDGRSWRNVGIRHASTVYDPTSNRHFAEAVAWSDAVLTEDGDYFDRMRSIVMLAHRPAEGLGESRVRAKVLSFPTEVLNKSRIILICLAVLFAGVLGRAHIHRWMLAASRFPGIRHALAWRDRRMAAIRRRDIRWTCAIRRRSTWLRRGRPATRKPKPPTPSRDTVTALFGMCFGVLAFPFLLLITHDDFQIVRRHTPPAASTEPIVGIRERMDRMVDHIVFSWDEAVEIDTRPMMRRIEDYMATHRRCRRLLVVSGATHARFFEQYQRDGLPDDSVGPLELKPTPGE